MLWNSTRTGCPLELVGQDTQLPLLQWPERGGHEGADHGSVCDVRPLLRGPGLESGVTPESHLPGNAQPGSTRAAAVPASCRSRGGSPALATRTFGE